MQKFRRFLRLLLFALFILLAGFAASFGAILIPLFKRDEKNKSQNEWVISNKENKDDSDEYIL